MRTTIAPRTIPTMPPGLIPPSDVSSRIAAEVVVGAGQVTVMFVEARSSAWTSVPRSTVMINSKRWTPSVVAPSKRTTGSSKPQAAVPLRDRVVKFSDGESFQESSTESYSLSSPEISISVFSRTRSVPHSTVNA